VYSEEDEKEGGKQVLLVVKAAVDAVVHTGWKRDKDDEVGARRL
jgi:hypothetical protein